MDVSTTIKKFGLEQAFKYLYKDPEKNLLKLMDWADKFSGGEFVTQRKLVREAMTNPEQRTETYRRIRHYRATKPLFAMDFQNDTEYVGGCIAGGRRYFHINANGEIDPCVFIHYSDSNIRKKRFLRHYSLLYRDFIVRFLF